MVEATLLNKKVNIENEDTGDLLNINNKKEAAVFQTSQDEGVRAIVQELKELNIKMDKMVFALGEITELNL